MTTWNQIIKKESGKDYFKRIIEFIQEDGKKHEIYPPRDDIFNAFFLSPYDQTRVVILGQDPYHNPGQAHGLSFSVKPGCPPPPSLVNIYKELKSDLGIEPPNHGHLESWAKQGVLLINATLTVRKNEPNSHKDIGWDIFTNQVISYLNEKKSPVVFILWGGFARSKKKFISNSHHFIVESAHPSPLSAYNGFFGSKPFSQTNNFLIENGQEPINWKLEQL